MNRRPIEDAITDWLVDEAPGPFPDHLFRAALDDARASRRSRRGAWVGIAMRAILPAAAAGAAVIAIVLIALAAWSSGRTSRGFGGPGASTPTPVAASPSASLSGQVAFQRTVDANTDIFVSNVDTSGLTPLEEVRLTDDAAVDGEPSWSPDGARIAFTRGPRNGGDIYVMNADGTGETRLTTSPAGDRQPAFSPDGSRIAFLRFEDPEYFDIYVMDSDGSNQRLVFHVDGLWVSWPAWSPDGTALYFNQDASGGGEIDIVRLDLDIGERTVIAAAPGDDSSFALSPDGTTIAFHSDREPGGIFLMDADGSNVRHFFGSATEGSPMSWSPDGQHLVFGELERWLYLVRADGTGLTRWREGEHPAWRPVE